MLNSSKLQANIIKRPQIQALLSLPMLAEPDSFSEAQLMTKRYYSEVAQKIGSRIRKRIMSKENSPAAKSLKQQKFRITFLANSLSSLNSDKTAKNASPNFHIQAKNNLDTNKRKNLLQFKQKLKQNLASSRIKKDQETQDLTNKIKWRKANMILDKQVRLEQSSNRKKYEADVMKLILEKSREYVKVVRRQNQLEHAFKCFQRRIKISTQRKDNK